MQASSITICALGFLLAAGCTTTSHKKFGQLEAAADETQLNVSFSAAGVEYQRTVSDINRSAIGWIENGTWRASSESGVSEVKIYLATLYNGKAFSKNGVKEIRTIVRGLSSLGAPDFGEEGEISTNSGPIEYIFFRRDAKTCVFIRKYWSEPELTADIIQLTSTFKWVAGQSVIHASDCRPGNEDLKLKDLNRLFNGIKAKNLYWPDSMFTSSDGTLGGEEF